MTHNFYICMEVIIFFSLRYLKLITNKALSCHREGCTGENRQQQKHNDWSGRKSWFIGLVYCNPPANAKREKVTKEERGMETNYRHLYIHKTDLQSFECGKQILLCKQSGRVILQNLNLFSTIIIHKSNLC